MLPKDLPSPRRLASAKLTDKKKTASAKRGAQNQFIMSAGEQASRATAPARGRRTLGARRVEKDRKCRMEPPGWRVKLEIPKKKASSMMTHAEGLAQRLGPSTRPSAELSTPVLLTLPGRATPLQLLPYLHLFLLMSRGIPLCGARQMPTKGSMAGHRISQMVEINRHFSRKINLSPANTAQ